jgi:hypothetical protein
VEDAGVGSVLAVVASVSDIYFSFVNSKDDPGKIYGDPVVKKTENNSGVSRDSLDSRTESTVYSAPITNPA